MNALIVGASGHLGAHLARVLLAEGHRVRALVRPTSRTEGLAALDLELVRGDALDPRSLGAALRGCEVVFHLGAPTTEGPGTGRTIVEGTRNVLEQALAAGAARVVYTSSIATVGYARAPSAVLDESSNDLTTATSYHVAKWHAERLALAFTRDTGLPVVVVNPATVVGPLDYRVTPSSAPIQRCLERGLPITFPAGLTIVHAEDVARGHLLAALRGRAGRRYILGGERLTVRDYFALICRVCGRPGPRLHLPRGLMLAAGAGGSLLRRLGSRQVPFTFRQARHLVGKYGWYSSARAAAELGYAWRPAREAVADYVEWARATGRAA